MILIGRFHPLLVHLPVGILVLAFALECLAYSKKYEPLRVAVGPSLLMGALSAIVAAFSGYLLSNEGGYDESLLQWHQYLGIATAIMSVITYVVLDRTEKKPIRFVTLFLLIIILSVTGHLGGSLTHGEDFLFASGEAADQPEKIVMSTTSLSNPAEAKVFDEIVVPILSQKCYSCHSSKKQKGQLRLDTREGLTKGGKNGSLLVTDRPGESELLKRIVLPIEDEHHMPPEEREQLTTQETEVIKSWIEEGSSFDKKLKELKKPKVIEEYIQDFSSGNNAADFPVTEAGPADPKVIEELTDAGVKLSVTGMNSNYLVVSFSVKRSMAEADVVLLKGIADNIIELDLSECEILEGQMKTLPVMSQLRRLVLTRSSITDEELAQIPVMANLSSINLNATRISGGGVASLKKMPALKKLFLFQTEVKRSEFENLNKALPQVMIDSGNYRMPVLVSDTVIHKQKTK